MPETYSDLGCTMVVTNMSAEDFKDAMIFLRKAENETDEFAKRRYLRASCVFFCATVESWCRKTIVYHLRMQTTPLIDAETQLLTQLTDSEEKPLHRTINELLESVLPNICGITIDDEQQNILNNYYQLTRFRNNFIHYSDRSYDEQYNNGEISVMLHEAPANIGLLIGIFEDITSVDWYQDHIAEVDN